MNKDRLNISKTFRIVALALVLIGIAAFVSGLFSDPASTWGSYLVAIYYFLSLAIGAAFFLSIQNITQSGWSSAFKRVPEAMIMWIPVSFVFFILLYFGSEHLYHWSQPESSEGEQILIHKSPYLNVTFFFTRLIISFVAWSILALYLRRLSLKQDTFDPSDTGKILRIFRKTEIYSGVFIFVLALTFSIAAFDLIMSIESHWFSSIFAFKNFVGAFLHGVSIIALIVLILYRRGYFSFLNVYHLHDFARYIFILSIIWGYMWFAQFMIIWYGNIPEETAYYYDRWQQGWKIFFWLQIALNWGVPFLFLLPVKTSRNITVIFGVIIMLIIGQYIDLFVQIMPNITGIPHYGLIEAGIFLGFAGLFTFVVVRALSRAPLIQKNHPYLVESLEHEFE
ncbi:MAG TPA: hypothetical protein VHO50_04665 [Bacteroidales bacterium]|nr:hypothetical protein [Bacteroidales bacterium]